MQSDTTFVSVVAVFFKKTAIIIATHGQKILHWQLSKLFSLVSKTVILRQ